MRRIFFLLLVSVIAQTSYGGIQPELSFEYETFRMLQEIPVIFTVRNVGNNSEEFFIYDNIYKTFFIDLRTEKNDQVELSYDFIVKHDFFNIHSTKRSIILKPDQSFSVRLDISKIFDISKPGVYYIRGIFSPDGMADKRDGLFTDFYKIIIKPPRKVEEVVVSIDTEFQKKQQELYNLPPYEVVRRMLDAKYRRDAKEYLIYFDFDKLIAIFPSFSKRYDESKTASEKARVIEKFKEYLTTYWEDPILSFSIIRTEIEGDKAKVIADVEYKLRNTSYKLRYSYELFRTYDNRWLIYSYEAVNFK